MGTKKRSRALKSRREPAWLEREEARSETGVKENRALTTQRKKAARTAFFSAVGRVGRLSKKDMKLHNVPEEVSLGKLG